MQDNVILTIEKLKELCPKCANELVQDSATKGITVKKVSMLKVDYDRLTKQDVGGTMEAIKKNEDRIEKLKKDIETVLCWRKFGKSLNREQQEFANRVAGDMIGMKTEKQVGVQLVSKSNIDFIKKGMIEKGNDAGATIGITQDAVAIGPAKKPCTCGKDGCSCDVVTKGGPGSGPQGGSQAFNPNSRIKEIENYQSGKTKDITVGHGFANVDDELKSLKSTIGKASIPKSDEIKATLPTSAEESGKLPRKSPEVASISKEPIEGQKDGQVNAVADSKTDPRQLSPDDKGEIKIEEIGHQPNLPMPVKICEELIRNAKWGVEIGAYKSVAEAIERILGNKEYSEFTDTEEKKKAVIACLTSLNKE